MTSTQITEPTLDFRSDGSVFQSGPLLGGHTVLIRYDRSRLAGGLELAGVETRTWMFSGFCSMNGGEPRPFAVGAYASEPTSEQRLGLPKGGTLALWFECCDLYGDHRVDSNAGQNFCFPVSAAPPDARGAPVLQVG